MSNRPFSIPVPIWDTHVHVLFKKRGLKTRLTSLDLDEEDIEAALHDDYAGIAMINKVQEAVIILDKHDDLAELLGVFAHESFHAAHMILDARGVSLRNADNNESHAYLVGYLVHQGAEKLLKKKS